MKQSKGKQIGKIITKKVKSSSDLEKISKKVAGIDIASRVHYAAVSPDLTEDCIRYFNAFTADLHSLADWLTELGIESVAMESTGVYWQSLYEVLEQRGFEVILVNARYPKNVSGRKSDVSDSSWIQTLHSYGLLPASFIPSEDVREFRTYVRERQHLIKQKTQHLQKVGKALQLMNVKIQNVISDIEGKLGMQVIRSIAAGEHSVEVLSTFYNKRLKASKEDFTLSLEGNYRADHLFSLKQALAAYDFVIEQMKECETEIEKTLHKWDTGEIVEDENWQGQAKTGRVRKNDYSFDVSTYVKDITGVDLMKIDGFSENTIINILAEVGTDMSRWKNAKHFTSWLALAPRQKISGDKLLGHFKNKHSNRAHQAFKLAAWGLGNSKCHLGALYRSISHRRGAGIAVQAVARKLATIFYTMMKNKTDYQGMTAQEYQELNKKRRLKALQKQAKKMGMKLVGE